MNNFTNNSAIKYSSVEQYYGYLAVGSPAVLTNSLIILILSTNPNLFANNAFVFGLALGDTLDGIALLGNGATRVYKSVNKIPNANVHPFQCMLTFTSVFLKGNQIPGAMFALIGLERYLAVAHFHWYHTRWTPRKAWFAVSAAYAVCAVSLGVAFFVNYSKPSNVRTSDMCATPNVMGPGYMFYNYGLTIVGGTVAVTTTFVAMVIFTKRKARFVTNSNMSLYVKNQWRHTRSMLGIAVLDLGLVVIPNFLIILSNVFNVSISSTLPTASLITVSARSCFNIVIYLLGYREF